MRRLNQGFGFVIVVSFLLVPIVGLAQSSKDYAQMARATWSAFECSSIASKAGERAEQERLFLFGYEQGKSFIKALEEQKIVEEDLSSEAPLVMLMLLQGPTSDFMLGRMFESAQDSALEDIYRSGDIFYNEDEQRSNAENKFWRLNCNLIGK